MILPMMGLLFMLFALGLLVAVVFAVVPALRPFAPFAFVPMLASVGAFVLCWSLAIGLETLFGSGEAGGIGFFAGYPLGGWLGGWLGWSCARRAWGERARLISTDPSERV